MSKKNKKHKKHKKHKNVNKQTNKNKNDSYAHRMLNKQIRMTITAMRIDV